VVTLKIGTTNFTLKVLNHFNSLVRYLEAHFFLAYHIVCCMLIIEGTIVCKVQRCHEWYCHSTLHLGAHFDKATSSLSGEGKHRAKAVGKDCAARSGISVAALAALTRALLRSFPVIGLVLFPERMDLAVKELLGELLHRVGVIFLDLGGHFFFHI
jgi:hypothetical protein